RRQLRSARLLPSAVRLHHVHARRRRLLRRVPPRDRESGGHVRGTLRARSLTLASSERCDYASAQALSAGARPQNEANMDDFDDETGVGLPDDEMSDGPDLGDLDEAEGDDVDLDLEGGDDMPAPKVAAPAVKKAAPAPKAKKKAA